MWPTFSAIVLAVAVLLHNVDGFAIPKEFKCKNSLISDQWRRLVLTFHNDKRRLLSQGKQPSLTLPAPWAKNIEELVWDCDLEYYAQTQNCNGKIDDQKYMSNVEEFSTIKKCELNSQTSSILKSWWDEVKKVDLAASQEYVPGLEHFAPMAAAEAVGFACTYDECSSSKSKLLCIYDKVLVFNDKIYDEGNSAADICATCAAQQKCTAWLCQEDYSPVGDIPPRVCADGLTNDLAATALNMHNYYRRQVATGWMVDKKNGYAPAAKQMLALKYDCAAIGAKARAKANNCPATAPTADAGYSLNHYYVNDWKIPRAELLQQAVESWAKQVSDVGVGKDNIYTAKSGVDSYANLAFEGATQLGCAVEVCVPRGSSVVVCEYDRVPQDGNVIYTIGRTCSGCAAQSKKCEQLRGLCV